MKEESLNYDDYLDNDREDDEFFTLIADAMKSSLNNKPSVSVTDINRLKDIGRVYKTMKHITEGKGIKVSYELNQPFASMGSVTIVGKEIRVTDPDQFVRTLESVSNFDVYPKTDGTVQMDFTFHGLTMAID